MLRTLPFEIYDGTNTFNDEFCALCISLPVERYVSLQEEAKEESIRMAYRHIAETVSEVGAYIRFVVAMLSHDEGLSPVKVPTLQITSAIVEHALADAEELIRDRAAVSGLDRVHTAFHGYLKAACEAASLPQPVDSSMTTLFKILREQHPAFVGAAGPGEIGRILRTLASVVDALNTLRNRNSIAHANEELLNEPEAMLTINSVRTLLHYADARITEKAALDA